MSSSSRKMDLSNGGLLQLTENAYVKGDIGLMHIRNVTPLNVSDKFTMPRAVEEVCYRCKAPGET